MKFIIGLIVVLGSVFGGYVLSHGHLVTLFQPFELLIIGGGALGAFIIANPGNVISQVLRGLPGLFAGAKYSKKSYLDLLSLMFRLFSKVRKEGLIALESDIDEPHESEIFNQFPKIISDQHTLDFICDYLRLMVSGNMNALELESLMDVELETRHHEANTPSSAMQTIANGLPGFGIVAAIMSVVITMGYIGEPPDVLGHHIAAALVGTFLGILLAYGFAAPMSRSMEFRAADEGKFLECAKICLLSTLNGYPPQIAVEFGRKTIYSHLRPSFSELEEHIKSLKSRLEH